MSFERLQIAAFLDRRAVKLQARDLRIVASHMQAAAQDIRSKMDLAGPDLPDEDDPIRVLMRIAAENTQWGVQDIMPGGGKVAELVRLRNAVLWSAKQRFGMSNAHIARRLGCDRTTVVHSIQRAEYYREREQDFRELCDSLLCAAQRCPHCHHTI